MLLNPHYTDRLSRWLQTRAQLPYIQLRNEQEERRGWWAVIAAHKATRHLPTQAVYGTWLVSRGQKAEVMDGIALSVGRKARMESCWKCSPTWMGNWLWLRNCPFLYLLYIYLQQWVCMRYICHMALVDTDIAEKERARTRVCTSILTTQSFIKSINHVAGSSIVLSWIYPRRVCCRGGPQFFSYSKVYMGFTRDQYFQDRTPTFRAPISAVFGTTCSWERSRQEIDTLLRREWTMCPETNTFRGSTVNTVGRVRNIVSRERGS